MAYPEVPGQLSGTARNINVGLKKCAVDMESDYTNISDSYLSPEELSFYPFFTFLQELLRPSNTTLRWDLWGTFKSNILCQSTVSVC